MAEFVGPVEFNNVFGRQSRFNVGLKNTDLEYGMVPTFGREALHQHYSFDAIPTRTTILNPPNRDVVATKTPYKWEMQMEEPSIYSKAVPIGHRPQPMIDPRYMSVSTKRFTKSVRSEPR